jgi:hypothetical protein
MTSQPQSFLSIASIDHDEACFAKIPLIVSGVNLLSSITRSFVIMVIVCFISNPMFVIDITDQTTLGAIISYDFQCTFHPTVCNPF